MGRSSFRLLDGGIAVYQTLDVGQARELLDPDPRPNFKKGDHDGDDLPDARFFAARENNARPPAIFAWPLYGQVGVD